MLLNQDDSQSQSVFVSIVGRPNVGKSSLLNRLTGIKTAIVTPKPQTTRTRITGVMTKGALQYVFLDTPGFHKPRTKLGEKMVGTVRNSMADADVVLMLFEPEGTLAPDEQDLLAALQKTSAPALAIVNKTDQLDSLSALAKRVEEIQNTGIFTKVLGVSALSGEGCDPLLDELAGFAQKGPHFFPDDAYTPMPERALVAEIVREKLLLHLREEIPHGTLVEVDRFHEREGTNLIDIEVVIFCEKKSHKGMVIGKGGSMLKTIASEARADAEEMLGAKVNLKCWVKVRSDWRDDLNFLTRAGFQD